MHLLRTSPKRSFVRASRPLQQGTHEARNTSPFWDDPSDQARARSLPCRGGSDTFSRYRSRQHRSTLVPQAVRVDTEIATLAGGAARVLRECCRQNSYSRTPETPPNALVVRTAVDEKETCSRLWLTTDKPWKENRFFSVWGEAADLDDFTRATANSGRETLPRQLFEPLLSPR